MARRRKRGDRRPSGKLNSPERERYREGRFPPTLVHQMVEAGRAKIINAAFGTQLGRLRLEGVISDAHVAAANHFCRFLGRYDRATGNPSRTVKSPDYRLGRAGSGDADQADSEPELVERLSRQRDDLDKLFTRDEWRAVYDTALLNEPCPWFQRAALVSALEKLGELYGYGRPAKAA